MRLFQLSQTLCLIVELGSHVIKRLPVLLLTHGDSGALTLVDAPHEKLLESIVLMQLNVLHLIGVAEPTGAQIAHHTVFPALQQWALRQHLPRLSFVHRHHFTILGQR